MGGRGGVVFRDWRLCGESGQRRRHRLAQTDKGRKLESAATLAAVDGEESRHKKANPGEGCSTMRLIRRREGFRPRKRPLVAGALASLDQGSPGSLVFSCFFFFFFSQSLKEKKNTMRSSGCIRVLAHQQGGRARLRLNGHGSTGWDGCAMSLSPALWLCGPTGGLHRPLHPISIQCENGEVLVAGFVLSVLSHVCHARRRTICCRAHAETDAGKVAQCATACWAI